MDGGGEHFSFFNQPSAAAANFHMFWRAVGLLVPEDSDARQAFGELRDTFGAAISSQVQNVFRRKLGLKTADSQLLANLFPLMTETKADYTIFFRELSQLPENVSALARSYGQPPRVATEAKLEQWFAAWRSLLLEQHEGDLTGVDEQMKQTNPKYTWREWLIADAYKKAALGDYAAVHELQKVFSDPYGEQSPAVEDKFDRTTPKELSDLGGISHYSCSS